MWFSAEDLEGFHLFRFENVSLFINCQEIQEKFLTFFATGGSEFFQSRPFRLISDPRGSIPAPIFHREESEISLWIELRFG